MAKLIPFIPFPLNSVNPHLDTETFNVRLALNSKRNSLPHFFMQSRTSRSWIPSSSFSVNRPSCCCASSQPFLKIYIFVLNFVCCAMMYVYNFEFVVFCWFVFVLLFSFYCPSKDGQSKLTYAINAMVCITDCRSAPVPGRMKIKPSLIDESLTVE